jgi:hypothetical protein
MWQLVSQTWPKQRVSLVRNHLNNMKNKKFIIIFFLFFSTSTLAADSYHEKVNYKAEA